MKLFKCGDNKINKHYLKYSWKFGLQETISVHLNLFTLVHSTLFLWFQTPKNQLGLLYKVLNSHFWDHSWKFPFDWTVIETSNQIKLVVSSRNVCETTECYQGSLSMQQLCHCATTNISFYTKQWELHLFFPPRPFGFWTE